MAITKRQVYKCTIEGCTFKADNKKAWYDHYEEVHKIIKRKVTKHSFKCFEPGCKFITEDKNKFRLHLAGHDIEANEAAYKKGMGFTMLEEFR